jgi:four helix bundle protein
MMPYEKFEAWKLCHKLVLAVYRASAKFPAAERYGLASQARRAAFSAAANIAEGSAKRGTREFRRYLDISIGSLAELSYTLLVVRDLQYLTSQQYDEVDALRVEAGKATWGLYRSMGKRA